MIMLTVQYYIEKKLLRQQLIRVDALQVLQVATLFKQPGLI